MTNIIEQKKAVLETFKQLAIKISQPFIQANTSRVSDFRQYLGQPVSVNAEFIDGGKGVRVEIGSGKSVITFTDITIQSPKIKSLGKVVKNETPVYSYSNNIDNSTGKKSIQVKRSFTQTKSSTREQSIENAIELTFARNVGLSVGIASVQGDNQIKISTKIGSSKSDTSTSEQSVELSGEVPKRHIGRWKETSVKTEEVEDLLLTGAFDCGIEVYSSKDFELKFGTLNALSLWLGGYERNDNHYMTNWFKANPYIIDINDDEKVISLPATIEFENSVSDSLVLETERV